MEARSPNHRTAREVLNSPPLRRVYFVLLELISSYLNPPSSHTSLTPHFLESKHLGIRSTSFPALGLPAPCWVESEMNCSTSSKNDGITDRNKHYHKTKVLKNPRRNYTEQKAGINNRGYLLNRFVTTWLVYIWSFSSHGFHFARTPEDSDKE